MKIHRLKHTPGIGNTLVDISDPEIVKEKKFYIFSDHIKQQLCDANKKDPFLILISNNISTHVFQKKTGN